MSRIIFAISGWVKSGKDTMANILLNEFNAERIAFADPLKMNVVRDFHSVSLEMTHNQELKEKPILSMPVEPKDAFSRMICNFMIKEFRTKEGKRPEDYCYNTSTNNFYGTVDGKPEKVYYTARALCILEGSTKRTADSDYWVKKAIEKATEDGLFVISDLRYKSELAGIKMAMNNNDKLVTIRINRFDTTESNDPSERDLDDATFDYVIENRGTLEDYKTKIYDILKERGI